MGAGPASADGAGIIQTVWDWNLPSALYGTIDNLAATSWVGEVNWLSTIMSLLATFLLFSWFITSSDSGTLVITTMLSMGDENPPKKFRIIWGLLKSLREDPSANPISKQQTAPDGTRITQDLRA